MTRRLTLALSALLTLALPGQTATLHVSKAGDGSDGLSWPTAYNAIGDALAVSASGDEIWVASGTYHEKVHLATNVALFGGFDGSEVSDEIRDWDINQAVIDGNGLHDSAVIVASDSVLDGFTIRDADTPKTGGGLFCNGYSPRISNCTFYKNVSSATYVEYYPGSGGSIFRIVRERGAGGAAYLYKSNTVFQNCEFRENSTNNNGGAVSIISSSFVSFENCRFFGNTSRRKGGAVELSESNLTVTSCLLEQNRAGTGGALDAYYGSLTINNSHLNSNQVNETGGALYLWASVSRITDSFIDGNRSGSEGAGIRALAGNLTITNCLISDNTNNEKHPGISLISTNTMVENSTFFRNLSLHETPSTNSAGGIYFKLNKDSTSSVKNCIFWDHEFRDLYWNREGNLSVTHNLVGEHYEGPGNIDADPLFVDPDNGDFRLQYGSPCIDSGTIVETLTDLDGNARPVDIPGLGVDGPGAFDMGAYEYQFPQSDLNRNGYTEAMDLFIMGSDWMKVSGAP